MSLSTGGSKLSLQTRLPMAKNCIPSVPGSRRSHYSQRSGIIPTTVLQLDRQIDRVRQNSVPLPDSPKHRNQLVPVPPAPDNTRMEPRQGEPAVPVFISMHKKRDSSLRLDSVGRISPLQEKAQKRRFVRANRWCR